MNRTFLAKSFVGVVAATGPGVALGFQEREVEILRVVLAAAEDSGGGAFS